MTEDAPPSPPFVSYSINYEDVILRRLFPGRTDGFFVDVGAQHPSTDNDFFALSQLGWTGINIEPNQAFATLLRAQRPRDRTVDLPLSDVAGQELLFCEVEGTGLSTFDQAQAQIYAAQGFVVRHHRLRTSTLRDVLEAASAPHIDVLKVDVEGYEEQVLAGHDWQRWRPSIVVVEATYPNTPRRRPTGIRAMLERVGYRHILFDNLNDFYADAEFAVPEGATLPPNVFDHFVRHETVLVGEEAARLRTSFTSADGYAHSLEDEAVTLRAQIGELEVDQAVLRRQARLATEDRQTAAALAQFLFQLLCTCLRQGGAGMDRWLTAGPPHSVVGRREEVVSMSEPTNQPGRQLVTVPGQGEEERDEERHAGALVPADMHAELVAARLDGMDAQLRRLHRDCDDLRHENARLRSSSGQLQGENLALSRALAPTAMLRDEVMLLGQRLEAMTVRMHGEAQAAHAAHAAEAARSAELAAVTAGAQAAATLAVQAATEAADAARATLTRQPELVREAIEALVLAQAEQAGDGRDDAAEAMLLAVHRSTSWRLTRPLRAVGRLFKAS